MVLVFGGVKTRVHLPGNPDDDVMGALRGFLDKDPGPGEEVVLHRP